MGWLQRGMRERSGVVEIFYMLVMIVTAWMGTLDKTSQTVYLKWVGFIGCKMYNAVY